MTSSMVWITRLLSLFVCHRNITKVLTAGKVLHVFTYAVLKLCSIFQLYVNVSVVNSHNTVVLYFCTANVYVNLLPLRVSLSRGE